MSVNTLNKISPANIVALKHSILNSNSNLVSSYELNSIVDQNKDMAVKHQSRLKNCHRNQIFQAECMLTLKFFLLVYKNQIEM